MSQIAQFEKNAGHMNAAVENSKSIAVLNSPGEDLEELRGLITPGLKNGNLERLEKIKNNVSQNPEAFSIELKKDLDQASVAGNQQAQIEIYTMASLIPLGVSPLFEESERLLKNMSQSVEPFNDVLFKSAFQFYSIQAAYRSEDNGRIKNELMDASEGQAIQLKIKKIFSEVKLNSKEEGGK